jgi:hypothetical protein
VGVEAFCQIGLAFAGVSNTRLLILCVLALLAAACARETATQDVPASGAAGSSTADTSSVSARHTDATEEGSIRAQLMATWNKPDAPLTAGPIIISGDHAVVDWTQPGVGGRALLFRHEGTWQVVLCTGDLIRTTAGLESVGVPTADAQILATKLAEAETQVPAERLARMTAFNGIVRMAQHEATH